MKHTDYISNVPDFAIKNVQSMRGHEGIALRCTLYFKGKKVAEFYDDAGGGEPDLRFVSNEAEKEVASYLKSKNFAQLMFDNGWQFMGTPEKISLPDQVQNVIDGIFSLKELEKARKKIEKDCEKAICFGTPNRYMMIGNWKHPSSKTTLDLKTVAKFGNGLEMIQKAYDRAKAELKEGEQIFNKNLKELGIKL